MCLAIPGKILSREEKDGQLASGKVDFGGVVKEVCLAYVPDAKVGDYVIVHVGFALNTLDEESAKETFEYLRQLGELPDPS
ncbi:MAG TPA: hydrogenase assembly protein HupF [Elusimicrobia bacterium]|nr:hydrogenase assembly protein HupF [Elusimicrobiota bacterium]